MRVVGALVTAIMLSGAGTATAQEIEAGKYLCTVAQRAGIGMIHLEGADPPSAFVDAGPTVKFRIEVARGPGYVVTELPYDGPDASGAVWQTDNAILHSAYIGDGWEFTAKEDQAFLRMHQSIEPNTIWFWHSGFEYPGGVDTKLTVRWGRCIRESNKAS